MYLGVDVGTSSVKVVLIDPDQRILATQSEPLTVERPHPGWSEQDPQSWVEAAGHAIDAVAQAQPKAVAAVRGVGLSGHMHGATLLDHSERPLRPCILWNDGRSHEEAAALDADPRFRALTGNIVFPGFTAPKLAWVQKHEPRVFKDTVKVLLPKDYVRLWLSGDCASDMSDASGTAWLDVGRRAWSDELLAATHLDRERMPKLYEGTEPTGKLRAVLASRWSMALSPVIAGGAGDNAAAACGVGVVAPGSAFLSLGTSGVLFVANEAFRPNPESAVHTFCHALPGVWHQMGVILSATASLEWLAGTLGVSAAELAASVDERPAGPGGLLFLPYLSGERTPHNDAAARGAFVGLGHETDRPALARAVMEGVAFAFADTMAALKAAGTRVERATAVGGGSRSRAWLQIVANVLDIPLDIPAEGDFGAALGAARLGLVAAEQADPLAVCAPPPIRDTVEPDADAADAYAAAFARYRALYPRHQGLAAAMSTGFFGDLQPVRFEGADSANPLAYRHYDPDRMVLGKRMEDHLRFSVAYWHSFAWPGGDPFGGPTFERPWFADGLRGAHLKADVAFEMFDLLGVPFFAFHDRDIAPEGATLAESNRNVRQIGEVFARKMETSKTRLLWGTANLFSHRRYMAGAATNPDPEVFAYAAAQVKNVLELTHELGGRNYVLWGGREGYETLLNTDLKRELAQFGRFLTLVVEHADKIGFQGAILIEPKPKEPTKHQYDFDTASIYGMLQAYDLEHRVRLNLEQNHAILAGHSFEHEIQLAGALGLFGSLDLNRGDNLLGWDTDQFAMNVGELTLALYEFLKLGGFTTGGMNFDAKIRRQSIAPDDLIHAHIGSMDATAKALLNAAALIEDGGWRRHVDERYAGWDAALGEDILSGRKSLDDLAAFIHDGVVEPQPKSGRQEVLENLVNRFS